MEKETSQLVREINAFLKRHRMAPSSFGRLYSNNSALVSRLRGNLQSPTFDTAASLRKWMKLYDERAKDERD